MASYEKRGKKTRVVVSVTEGTVRKKVSRTFATKKEAQKWATKMEAERNDGVSIVGSNMAFADYYKQWMKVYKLNDVKASTAHIYKQQAATISRIFGDITMAQLTPLLLQAKMDDYGEDKLKSTVNDLLVNIKASLRDGLYDGYITRDIYSRVKPHGGAERVKKNNVLSATQFETLQTYLLAHHDDLRDLAILVMLETGIRVGECLGLKYSDVNLVFDFLTINKTYSSNVQTITTPKTASSVRNIKITHELAEMITARTDRKNATRIFETTTMPIRTRLNNLTKQLGLTPITIHGLRHSHASYLLYKGVSINYVSARLGHTNTTITQLVYAHMLEEERVDEADKTVEILSKSPIVPKAKATH